MTAPVPGERDALVWFYDPAANAEVRLTVREAAAVILALQDQVRSDRDWDAVRDEDPTPIDTWLSLALDAEGYHEHVAACVLPRPDEPHPFDPDTNGDCLVCHDTLGDGPHPTPSPATREAGGPETETRTTYEVWPEGEGSAWDTFEFEENARAEACEPGDRIYEVTTVATITRKDITNG